MPRNRRRKERGGHHDLDLVSSYRLIEELSSRHDLLIAVAVKLHRADWQPSEHDDFRIHHPRDRLDDTLSALNTATAIVERELNRRLNNPHPPSEEDDPE